MLYLTNRVKKGGETVRIVLGPGRYAKDLEPPHAYCGPGQECTVYAHKLEEVEDLGVPVKAADKKVAAASKEK